jgi:hypothetical protein
MYAQKGESLDTVRVTAVKRPASYLEIGYSGATIFHPGVTIGWGKPVSFNYNENKGTMNEIVIGGQVGMYYHNNRHTGVYGGVVPQWTKTSKKGFQYGFELPVGYLRTFIPGVYETDESGNINHLSFAGTNHFIISPAFRLGHHFKEDFPVDAWFIKNRLMLMMPYPGGMTSQYFLEIGIVKNLNR